MCVNGKEELKLTSALPCCPIIGQCPVKENPDRKKHKNDSQNAKFNYRLVIALPKCKSTVTFYMNKFHLALIIYFSTA